MKKTLFVLLAGALVLSSCLKNNSTPACTDQKPEVEEASMLTFALTQGMTPTKDTLGILFQILQPGTTPLVSNTLDTVNIKYEGKLMSGSSFDKSDSTAAILVGQFVYGFQASLAKIGQGGRVKVVIPSYIAYGCQGSGPIPANSPVYFDITILKLGKKR
ncbi:FKBP-type peptidyl-prolyl cis-trans isomerase [Foetidibacter luteolus]|uniref:FKBP-type peptidyl-prolyl cis-trans isomerase n=1 Tax=Foetidibacter luteolus TaxID=2608880 RepID=UPI00129A31D5|nr:FKBP-type peptidyl-prolyl cis-trans isomerase [Foetidibacter luteolus]